MKTSIILVAAGKGKRFGQPKWNVQLAGKSLLDWCIETLEKLPFDKEIIIVGGKGIKGGGTRHESVIKGLQHASGELVILHNVANPMATVLDFVKIHDVLTHQDAAVFVGQKVVDTLRKVLPGETITIDRSHVWRVQTPQGFRTASLRKLVEANAGEDISDEIQLFEGTGIPVIGIETAPLNQKITFPHDLEMLEQYLRQDILVGIGEDSHRFDESGSMALGGVKVEGVPKLQGNSDGDVILHALFNAMSSALGKRSLSLTADPMVEQGIIDSAEYLQVILRFAAEHGWVINNISISLECQQPRIEPLVDQLKHSLSRLLELDEQKIGITATSGEGLSLFGLGEGIHCTCLISLRRATK